MNTTEPDLFSLRYPSHPGHKGDLDTGVAAADATELASWNISPIQSERFWRSVDKKGDDECWLWTGGLYPNGYPFFSLMRRHYLSHRISYFIANGPFPKALFVCHACDVTGCVNPKHLFLGTHRDNMRDMHQKGRSSKAHRWHEQARGTRTHSARLDDDKVRNIFMRRSETATSLAKEFGVHKKTVLDIFHRHTWVHVTGPMI